MSFDSPLPPYNASDPSATFLNSSCLDLLMIELVPMAYRIVNEIDIPDSPPPTSPSQSRAGQDKSGSGSVKSSTTGANGARKMDEDEERDAVFFRLEMLGYRVGQGLVERFVYVSYVSHLPIFPLPSSLFHLLALCQTAVYHRIIKEKLKTVPSDSPKTAPASQTH
jgi:hypothetical protein